jgi:hypothetical protein
MNPNSKLDARTRAFISMNESDASEASPDAVSVFLEGHQPFGEEELSQLRADGAEIETVAGTILTAQVPVSKITDLAEHDFVMRVQTSSPLYTEASEDGAPQADAE